MNDLEAFIAQLAPALQAAFLLAMSRLRAGVNYALLLDAIKQHNVDLAIYALNIEPAVFGPYVAAKVDGFATAGEAVSEELTKDRAKAIKRALRTGVSRSALISSPNLPPPPPGAPSSLTAPGGGRIEFRFDMTNPRAEALIRQEAAARVAGYTAEQVETARRVIGNGYAKGEGPVTIATAIAGRINPITKRREGGIIGLSDPQASYVESMKDRLASGDPAELRKILGTAKSPGMTLRDKRYDAVIKKAIREGKPVPAAKAKEMVARYSDRLLRRRAEDIARSETASGVELARAEATRQALEKAGLPAAAVSKTWIHQGGLLHPRNWHLIMNGVSVEGLDTAFHLPDGSVMQHPHDPAGGVRNLVNCRCRGQFDIDWAYGL